MTRWTGAEISTFEDNLGLFEQVGRVLVKYFTRIPLRNTTAAVRNTIENASREHVGGVRLGLYSALWPGIIGCSQLSVVSQD